LPERKQNNTNRLLLLSLTDGVNVIKAMEYERCPFDRISVGTLIVIKPGIELRKEVLLLLRANTEVVFTPLENQSKQQILRPQEESKQMKSISIAQYQP